MLSKNVYFSKYGFSKNQRLKQSLLLSKYFHYNKYTIPQVSKILIKFPLVDTHVFTKSKLLILILDFIETLTFCKPIVKQTKIFTKTENFCLCYVTLTKFSKNIFLENFNQFLINNNALRVATKPLKLKQKNNFNLNLFIFDLTIFFDVYTKKLLPKNKIFWLEVEFSFNKTFKLLSYDKLFNYYQQYFYSGLISHEKKNY